ncbi:GNAT family N-acetyltransferase [Blastococcus goldschmidtiae]|uniref:GNAT family N-acetyltransferase n=1 Tax=Blastococcus goldschmidtiae TaxID=3075546 RepID=A0ABU2KDW0_9ACTN|nr:GNAT family N-acetyltransferase [Blastococcus sp. DSM 46792]MDT0278381.1 GNAT family N-acetyltransferase [Blastococcus sp. DSM 46792]
MDPSPFPRLTGSADVSVRPARPEDAGDIARVQAVAWRTAYRSLLPVELLDTWDEDAAARTWRAAVEAAPTPAHRVLVALEGNTVVGFTAVGPAELTDGEVADPAAPTSDISTLLVEPRWGRRGHGSRLLAAVVDVARSQGVLRLRTWLPDSDEVSASFYESAGWEPDGWARTLDTGDEPLRELRWHTLLDGDEGDPA